MTTSFTQRVLAIVSGIPAGSVMTYAQVARAADHPGAARAVGTVVKGNFDTKIPCHRVVRSDGAVGEYNRGATQKIAKLRKEGLIIKNGRVKIL